MQKQPHWLSLSLEYSETPNSGQKRKWPPDVIGTVEVTINPAFK